MDQLKRDFSVLYICETCNTSIPPPTHCSKAMKPELINGVLNWVCWKGEHAPCCGTESAYEIEKCCENPILNPETPKVLF